MCQRLVVALDRGEEPAQNQIEAARLVARELAVAEISLVDDLGDGRQPAVAKPRAVKQCLERAVIPLVAELDARHVEGDRVGWQLVDRCEDELGRGIEEALDEPRGSDTVNVRPRAGGPAAALESLEVQPSRRPGAGLGQSCHPPLRRFPGTQRLLAARGFEEVDVAQAIQLAREPRQLFGRPRPLGRAELPVAVREGRVVGVAGLMEEPDDLGLLACSPRGPP